MSKNVTKSYGVTLLLIVALILSGCSGETCIEADDFGHAQFTISARYKKGDCVEENDSNQSARCKKEDFLGEQVGSDQVAPWRDSSYRVNGRPLTVVVRGWEYNVDYNNSSDLSAWCAWYGLSDDTNTLSKFCERLRDCHFTNDKMCTDTLDAAIDNAPCLFRNGVGLYALIAKKGVDPNLTMSSKRSPDGLSFHVGAPISGYKMYEVDKKGKTREIGGRVYDYDKSNKIKKQYSDSKLYFKIIDKFYDDNNGQYRVVVKSGITQVSPDPITYVTNMVKTFLFGADNDYGLIRKIYAGVIKQPGYRLAVSAMLTLYIMFTALSYLAGNIQVTHTELLTRVGKIAIVSALLSTEYSWSFFNDYLFVYFVGGVEQILQIIIEAGATGPGSPSILAMMIAPQTLSKLFSLLFVDWMGFIYIILFIAALYFVIMIFFEAAIIYLTALIAIGMIITMGPVFICFILFGITRSLFENWLKQLISYAIQPIILFTGLIFISMILRQEIYGSLGFRVCKKGFPKMSTEDQQFFASGTNGTIAAGLKDSIFYWWFPSPMKGENFSKDEFPIPVPIDHFTSGNNVVGSVSDNGFCEAYGCIEKRYIDLPFLDPDSPRDQQRIGQFHNGKFVQLDGMLLIFVAIYLLNKFNGLAVSVAKFLTGTSGNLTNISNVGDAVKAQTFGKMNKQLGKIPGRAIDTAIGRGDREKGREIRHKMMKDVKSIPSKIFDKVRVKGVFGKGGLENEALSKNANKAVLSEVEKNTGLKQSEINKNAIKDYQKALADKLGKIDNNLTENQRKNLAKKMSKKSLSQIKDELSKAQFNKEYEALSKDQKKDIDKLNDREFLSLARDAEKAKKFQKAYVDAYAAMSERGIGILGKHSKTIRSLEEIKHRSDKRLELEKEKNQQIGKEIYSEIEGVKGNIFAKATGGKYDPRHKHDGSAWHGINTDPRERYKKNAVHTKETYAEQLAQEKEQMKRAEITRDIESLNRKHGNNVTSPEFLVQARKEANPNLGTFQELERANVRSMVKDHLREGEEPSLMGNTYMSNYAKDSEMEKMVDRAYEVQKNIFADDDFISRKEQYEITQKLAEENIQSVYEKLQTEINFEGKTSEELITGIESLYPKDDLMNSEKAQSNIEQLKQSISDFNSSQEILQQIDKRKMEVAEEIESHVSGINEHRKNADMKEYRPEQPVIVQRKLRKIEDLLRK
jgi:type IV secretion system protein VirB6